MPAVPMSSDQIVDDLADRIKRGQYKPGQRLPKYDQLQRMYDVSHGTIALVIKLLKAKGVVIGLRGRGVYVAGTPQEEPEPSELVSEPVKKAVAKKAPTRATPGLRNPFQV